MFDAFDKKDDVKKQKYIEVDPFVISVKKEIPKKMNILLASPVAKKIDSATLAGNKNFILGF